METTEEIKFPLRILVHRERKKVVFAEANNDLVDVLLSSLTLPMGTIFRRLGMQSDSTQEAIGSLSTLYESLSNLDTEYFWSEECKNMLLKPRNSSEAECGKLKLNIDDNEPLKYFICENWDCSRKTTALLSTYNTARCGCGKLMNREIGLKDSNVNSNDGVFASKTATFIISDDLRVMPNFPASVLGRLSDLGIRDMVVLEEKTLNIGFKEILNLLKLALLSQTPLTDLFLRKSVIVNPPELGISARPPIGNETSNNSEKMTLKVMVQKSNNKALFVQAGEDFINFLFGLFTIPLGSVILILGANTYVGCLDNFYKSVQSMNVGTFIKSEDLKEMLLNPQLPPLYLCKNQIFGLGEESHPQFYCYISSYYNSTGKVGGHLTLCAGPVHYYGDVYSELSFRDPKVNGGFVRGPAFFMVTDDLVVTPMSTISSLSYLNRLKIPFSDVAEQVITIGIDEALSILKASLNSNSALSNGLKNFIIKKPKQEN